MRGAWPNPRSPLVWDPSAIFTYLTSTILFVYVALLPDLALARDRAPNPVSRAIYGVLAMGFPGNHPAVADPDRRRHSCSRPSSCRSSSRCTPSCPGTSRSRSVPGWHNTIFAPYFVIGAVHSGVSAVVTVMIVMRYAFGLKRFITRDHIDSLARLLIVVATVWLFFFLLDFFFGLYGTEPAEVDTWQRRLVEPPWVVIAITFIICGYIIPVGDVAVPPPCAATSS